MVCAVRGWKVEYVLFHFFSFTVDSPYKRAHYNRVSLCKHLLRVRYARSKPTGRREFRTT